MAKLALIDGDSIIYILAWQFKDREADETTTLEVMGAVDQFVLGILTAVDANRYIGALGHSTFRSFRYEIALYKPYKGTRRPKDEWVIRWEECIRMRLITEWYFLTLPFMEADDIISIAAHLVTDCVPVVCSPDKDLWQIPGAHFDYKKGDFADVTKQQADYFFAYQMLIGDDSDNVAGLPGFGPKKAKEKLDVVDLSMEFYEKVVLDLYQKYFGDYYGKIIFDENKAVLGLLKEGHAHYNKMLYNVEDDPELQIFDHIKDAPNSRSNLVFTHE